MFIEGCRSDMCEREGLGESLCGAVEAYTKECADQGVIIEWRNTAELKQCGMTSLFVNIFWSDVKYLTFFQGLIGKKQSPNSKAYKNCSSTFLEGYP